MSNMDYKCKYLLPKLKSYSQKQALTYANISVKKYAQNCQPATHQTLQTQDSAGMINRKLSTSKLRHNNFKYQYVNKSPNYFKKKNLSTHLQKFDDASYNQPVQIYLEQKIKDFDRKALIDLVNSRIKSISGNNKRFLTLEKSNQDSMNQDESQYGFKSDIQKLKQQFANLKLPTKESNFQVSVNNQNLTKLNKQSFRTLDHNLLQKNSSSRLKNNFSLNRKNVHQSKQIDIQQKLIKQQNKSEKKMIQFYDTKYSQFQANKILSLKVNIKNVKKYPSLKLNAASLY